MLLASDFSGLAPLIIGVPLVIGSVAFLSLYASALGHWLGPVLATPPLLLSLFFSAALMMSPENDMIMPWILCGTPLALSLASIFLWSVKRGTVGALAVVPVLVVITVAVLGTSYVVRARFLQRLKAEAAERAASPERARIIEMERALQAEHDAASADPANAEEASEHSEIERAEIERRRQQSQQ